MPLHRLPSSVRALCSHKRFRPRYPGQARRMSQFHVVEHTVRCQHTRDRPAGAELGRENDLRLHVKQYIPKSNAEAKPGDVTIIGAQANAFPKEMYEPFWDDLVDRMQGSGHGIRGIWIADMASQGQSGIINESLLGPDASWWDHGRDLLFFINQFQDDMPHPIIGIGHSVGASHLVHLSLLHPRLLHGLVLVDPIIQADLVPHKALARLSTSRRDIWPSREVAARKFAASKFYQQWDPRVLEKWATFGLRDLPTEQYSELTETSDASKRAVTLSTTKAQEVYFYLQALYHDDRLLRAAHDPLADLHPDDKEDFPFSRPEMYQLYRRLPELRPSVRYIFGKTSPASPPGHRDSKMKLTGTGVGGSGGAPRGKVTETILDCGHLVGFETPGECADASAAFLIRELDEWKAEEGKKRKQWHSLTRAQRVDINDKWRENLGVEENSTGDASTPGRTKL